MKEAGLNSGSSSSIGRCVGGKLRTDGEAAGGSDLISVCCGAFFASAITLAKETFLRRSPAEIGVPVR